MVDEFKINDYVVTIKETSDAGPEIKNISMLHIDGQHTEQAIRDAKKYASQVVLNGYCIVDDVDWGVVKNVPEILEKLGFVHVHSVDTAAIYKKLCYRTDVEI